MTHRRWIQALQFLSICLMWAFAMGVLVFIVWLVLVAARWHDALNWTLAISLIMAPVYLTVAGTLTYVFIGLRRGAPKRDEEPRAERRQPRA
jgi:heme/copper-type cytochrome/quinol oxidase subunit 2